MEALERQIAPKEDSAARKLGFVTSSIQLSETASGLIHNQEEIELPEVSDSDGEDDDVHKKMYQMLCTEVLLGNETKKWKLVTVTPVLVHLKELSGCDKNHYCARVIGPISKYCLHLTSLIPRYGMIGYCCCIADCLSNA
ncbi:hypothetical protein Tco_1560310 [Tanacetum coccineum]